MAVELKLDQISLDLSDYEANTFDRVKELVNRLAPGTQVEIGADPRLPKPGYPVMIIRPTNPQAATVMIHFEEEDLLVTVGQGPTTELVNSKRGPKPVERLMALVSIVINKGATVVYKENSKGKRIWEELRIKLKDNEIVFGKRVAVTLLLARGREHSIVYPPYKSRNST